MKLILSQDAKADLKYIYRYIADKNSKYVASKYLQKINSVTTLLIDNPYLGTARPDVGESMRFLPINKHLVFYYIQHQTVYISRVIPSSEDYSNKF